jgi:hypothetical protein
MKSAKLFSRSDSSDDEERENRWNYDPSQSKFRRNGKGIYSLIKFFKNVGQEMQQSEFIMS